MNRSCDGSLLLIIMTRIKELSEFVLEVLDIGNERAPALEVGTDLRELGSELDFALFELVYAIFELVFALYELALALFEVLVTLFLDCRFYGILSGGTFAMRTFATKLTCSNIC